MNARTAALAALSGVILALSFPDAEIPALAWIGFIPLFVALRDQTAKNGFFLGAVMGLVYFLGTIHWIAGTLRVYGALSFVPAWSVTLLLCGALALFPALFGAAAAHFRNLRPGLFFLLAPALWTALELARTHVLTGFPWSLIGASQYRLLPVIQIADLTGVYGVSFLIVLANAAIFEAVVRRACRPLIVAGLCLALTLGYGRGRLRVPEQPGTLTVSVIQGNIEQYKKWDPAYRTEVFATYTRLTREALGNRPDLVVWPETATPFYFNGTDANDRALAAKLIAFVQENGVPLLFGSPTYERTPAHRIIARNSAFLLSAGGRIDAEYRKMHLVPFGEYVPFRSALFFVDKFVQSAGDFEQGSEYTVMAVPSREGAGSNAAALGVVICYEIIFPELARGFVKRGASVIATITNDAWFGKTSAPRQHFSAAVFRAVENRVPVVRAANTGISGFIDARGKILAASEIFTETQLTRPLRPGTERTFYTRCGDMFAYGCTVSTLLMLAWRKRSPRSINPAN